MTRPLLALLAMALFMAPGAAAPTPAAARPAAHGAARASVLPFIADDYARALAVARSRKLPLFIESWAPW